MTKNHWKRMLGHPVVIAIAVACFRRAGNADCRSWPVDQARVQTAEVANHKTTGDAAGAVGAKVIPTAPKSEFEPNVPGPKPAEPAANPAP